MVTNENSAIYTITLNNNQKANTGPGNTPSPSPPGGTVIVTPPPTSENLGISTLSRPPPKLLKLTSNSVSPDFSVSPLSSPSLALNITFEQISETDPSGREVKSIILSGRPWRCLPVNTGNPFIQSSQCILPVVIGTDYLAVTIHRTHFVDQSAYITVDKQQFFVEQNTIKWMVSIQQWPFQSSLNFLKFTVGYATSESIRVTQVVNTTREAVSRYVYITQNGQFRVSFPQFFVSDSSLATFSKPINLDSQSPGKRSLQIYFPSFKKSLVYDPDLSVLAGNDDIEEPEEIIHSSDFSLLAIMIGSAIGIGGFIFVVVVTVVVCVRWREKIMKKEAKWKAVAFEEKRESEEMQENTTTNTTGTHTPANHVEGDNIDTDVETGTQKDSDTEKYETEER